MRLHPTPCLSGGASPSRRRGAAARGMYLLALLDSMTKGIGDAMSVLLSYFIAVFHYSFDDEYESETFIAVVVVILCIAAYMTSKDRLPLRQLRPPRLPLVVRLTLSGWLGTWCASSPSRDLRCVVGERCQGRSVG